MNDVMLTIALVSLIALSGALFWLFLQYRKLLQSHLELKRTVNRNSDDIAGICSAAVAVDNRLKGNDERLQVIAGKLEHNEKTDRSDSSAPQPYHSAIRRIQNGAGPDDLVRECGLTRDEAVLLISLHGLKN